MNSKRDLLLQLLSQSSAFVQLDGRAAGVELPEWLRGEPSVVLQLGYDMPVPIHDLKIDEAGVVATLSFRRTPFRCVVPWGSIYAIADEEGQRAVFAEQVPIDIATPPPRPAPVPAPVAVPARAARAPLLSPAPALATSSDSPPPPDAPPPAKPKRPNHLKLVK